MTTTSAIRVSIDVGCHSHSVAIGLPCGEVLDEFELPHRPEGFELFFDRIERHHRRYGGEVSVAMEGYNGWARPLDTLVRSRGYRLFNINNLKLARFKEIFPAAAKTDRIDARKGLELFQLRDYLPSAKGVLQEVSATPVENEKLKRLTRRRRSLVDEKSRLLSRMQADLQAVCPGLLAITKDAENLWFLKFTTYSDDLRKLARIRQKTVLSIKGIGRKYATVISDWQKTASFSHDVDWVGPMIVEDAQRILDLRQKIKALEVRCEELMGQSEIAQREIPEIPVTVYLFHHEVRWRLWGSSRRWLAPLCRKPALKTTSYFRVIRGRPDRTMIKDEWIQRAIDCPEREYIQEDGRIRRWARIAEMEGRYLRVVLLPDGETVHDAFCDRGFRP